MPLEYIDLVIKMVRGMSPVPELQNVKVDRSEIAKQHVEKLKNQYKGKSSGSMLLDGVLTMGSHVLSKTWNKLSPPALTMCGDKSIDNLLEALDTVRNENISGDFIEAGVWRGGLPIIMRAYLHSVGDKTRKVYLADSFSGLPKQVSLLQDKVANLLLEPLNGLSTSRKIVENAFDFFELNDAQVVFLEGWFSNTLPLISNETKFSICRLDGDYYESTKDAIINLYPKTANGGFLIVDDYNLPLGCKRAIDEYREEHRIFDKIIKINKQAVYWRKS